MLGKKTITLLFIISSALMFGQSIVNENFPYSQGTQLSGQGGWIRHSGSSNDMYVGTSSLSMSNYSSSSVGSCVEIKPTRADDCNYSLTSIITSGFTYLAFLVNASDCGTGTYSIHLGEKNDGTAGNIIGRIWMKKNSSNLNFGLSKYASTGVYSSTSYSFNTTYLVILRYEIKSGASNDEVKLWIKTSVPTDLTNLGTAVLTTSESTNDFNLGSICLRQATNSVTGSIDGIRLGTGSTDAIAWENIGLHKNYYSNPTGNLNSINSWSSKIDGTGTKPSVFTEIDKIFNIITDNSTIGAAWAVSGTNSKVIVGDGTNACTFTIPASYAFSGNIDVANNAICKVNNTTLPTLGTLASGSAVDLGVGVAIPSRSDYYKLTLSASSGIYSLAGNVTVADTFAAGNNTIQLGNSTLTINGNTTGTPTYVYNGSGTTGGNGYNGASAVSLDVTNPASVPATISTLTINNAAGVSLPNSVTCATLTISAGSLNLNANQLTVSGSNIAITSGNLASLSQSDVSNVLNTISSIARTWRINGSGMSQIIFDVDGLISGTVVVWKRAAGSFGNWTQVGSTYTVSGGLVTVIIAGKNGAKAEEDWTISEDGGTLPVELSSFTAIPTPQNFVRLDWITQSETGVSGYYLYRGMSSDLNYAERINSFIPAHNTSQVQEYSFMDREAIVGNTYHYWLQNLDIDGQFEFHGPVVVILTDNNGGGAPVVPLVTSLQKVYPNPFNPSTTLSYGLAKAEHVVIDIYNLKGAKVRTLVDQTTNSGTYRILWNGTDDSGSPVTTGVYYVKMTAGKYRTIQKIILVK